MNTETASFLKLVKHPLKFRMFLLTNLPSAYFAGARVKEADDKTCVTTIPYKWFSKNPFRSTYFACLSMAAEMSTGILGLAHTYKRKPSVSTLVIKVESTYVKKAVGLTTFTCSDGELFQKAIEESILTGEPREVKARSMGKNKDGELVAEFFVTWSFKAKPN